MDMRFYADGEGRVYRFLWQQFRESAERAAAQDGRDKMKERLAKAGGVSPSTVENHLRTRTKRGANFPCDITIIRAYGRVLERDESVFLELAVPRTDVRAEVSADPGEVLCLLASCFGGWSEEDRRIGETVFVRLWELLGLYAATDCYNRRPDTGELEGAEDYFSAMVESISQTAGETGDGDGRSFLLKIVRDVGDFVKRYELPGVPDRWLRLNPRLGYFDPVFELTDVLPAERLAELDAAGRFRIPFPTPWERRMRKLYFAAADGGEAVYFTRELQETLVRAFRQMR